MDNKKRLQNLITSSFLPLAGLHDPINHWYCVTANLALRGYYRMDKKNNLITSSIFFPLARLPIWYRSNQSSVLCDRTSCTTVGCRDYYRMGKSQKRISKFNNFLIFFPLTSLCYALSFKTIISTVWPYIVHLARPSAVFSVDWSSRSVSLPTNQQIIRTVWPYACWKVKFIIPKCHIGNKFILLLGNQILHTSRAIVVTTGWNKSKKQISNFNDFFNLFSLGWPSRPFNFSINHSYRVTVHLVHPSGRRDYFRMENKRGFQNLINSSIFSVDWSSQSLVFQSITRIVWPYILHTRPVVVVTTGWTTK